MLNICILFFLLVLCLIRMRRSPKKSIRYAALIIFNLLIIECFLYGYFLILIFKGTCFFLIGNQTVLDTLIKTRLSYSLYFAQGKKNFINQLDNQLGYTLGKDKDAGNYQTTKQGLRGNREYTLKPQKDILRLAVFGDSFIFCDDVTNLHVWPYLLEQSTNNLEVLNFGVPGYGLGQSYLRYLKDGLIFKPDIVLFNYILLGERDKINPGQFVGFNNLRMAHFYRVRFSLENNILTTQSTTPYELFDPLFKEKYLYHPLGITHPPDYWSWKILSISNLGLFLKQLAMRHYLDNRSAAQEPPDLKAMEEKINLRILENLLEITKSQSSQLIFFYHLDFAELPINIQQLLKKYDHVIYVNSKKALLERYKIHNLQPSNCQDLTPEQLCMPKELMNETGHFNEKGTPLYTEAILEILKNNIWGKGERRFQFNKVKNTFLQI